MDEESLWTMEELMKDDSSPVLGPLLLIYLALVITHEWKSSTISLVKAFKVHLFLN